MKRGGNAALEMCFFHYNNDHHIRLARDDQISFRKRKQSDWQMPTREEREENREVIRTLKAHFR
jgi:hypothetical protein